MFLQLFSLENFTINLVEVATIGTFAILIIVNL